MNIDYDLYFKTQLPFNRKEKFFTATILPSILFNNGLDNFFYFLTLVDNIPSSISEQNTGHHFIFNTEYNLKQSASRLSEGEIIKTKTNETPDVLIYLIKPERVLVVIEAKMYQHLSQALFDQQMYDQRNAVIDPIQNGLEINPKNVFHLGLVPKELKFRDRDEYQILTWDIFLDDSFNHQNNFFVEYLKFGLKHYESLVSKNNGGSRGTATTVKKLIKGYILYRNAKEGEIFWVGRQGGKSTFGEDAKSGKWKNFSYSWNDEFPEKGQKGNWIDSKKFLEIIEMHKSEP